MGILLKYAGEHKVDVLLIVSLQATDVSYWTSRQGSHSGV